MELELYLIEILHQTTTRYRQRLCCRRCILSKFYIKPQLSRYEMIRAKCCILSKFYIKPQRNATVDIIPGVVSYRNSTSNHNFALPSLYVKSLYLIEILHQTTTAYVPVDDDTELYLIEILHQTTTLRRETDERQGVVSYRNSTSNHNVGPHID